MKTKNKHKSEKTVIEQLREIRDKVNLDIEDMTLEQLKEYLKKKKTLHPTSVAKAGLTCFYDILWLNNQ